MATTRVSHTQLTVGGVTLTPTAADTVNGNNFVPYPGRILLLQNTGGSPVTVTAVTPGTRSGLAIADDTITVPANSLVGVSIADPTDFVSSAGQIDFTAGGALNVYVLQA